MCGFVCCGGKTKDTKADRAKLVMAMNALIISNALSFVLAFVITTIVNEGNFGGISHLLLNYIIIAVIAFWWRNSIKKWVANKAE